MLNGQVSIHEHLDLEVDIGSKRVERINVTSIYLIAYDSWSRRLNE